MTNVSAEPIELMTCHYADSGEVIQALVWGQDTHHISLCYPQTKLDERQGTIQRLHDGRSIQDAVRHVHHGCVDHRFISAPLLPGEFHPRIWRNGIADREVTRIASLHYYRPDFVEMRSRIISLHRIQKMLADAFEVVSPLPAHDAVTGGALRELLLLAAIEIEGLLSSAYQANNNTPQAKTNINSYSRLCAPMRLDEWELAYSYFDEAGARRPFQGWAHKNPPIWWKAYNALKHQPTHPVRYRDVLDCCLAVRALIEAQFGPHCETVLPDAGLATISVVHRPQWAPHELYFPPSGAHSLGLHRPKSLF